MTSALQAAMFDADEPILSFSGDHLFLSNFFRSPVEVSGPWWTPELCAEYKTVEHAFQAAKVEPATKGFAEHYRRIAAAPTPAEAKRLGSARGFAEYGATLRTNWEQDKVLVMLACLRAKFSLPFGVSAAQPEAGLAYKLLATGRRVLVEGNTWSDTYWGVCRGKGKNMLGRLLMLVRAELNVAAAAGMPVEHLAVRWWR